MNISVREKCVYCGQGRCDQWSQKRIGKIWSNSYFHARCYYKQTIGAHKYGVEKWLKEKGFDSIGSVEPWED